MIDLSKIDYEFYRYNPSAAAAGIFVVLFALATATHSYYAWRYRARFFIVFLCGGLCETIGYVGRALSHNNNKAIGPFVMQNMLLLVAPALFAATIYMVLGRIMRLLHAEHHSLIRTTRLTKTFVLCDLLCFWIQGGGGGIQAAGTPTFFTIGRWLIVVGLLLQIVVFCLFVAVAYVFHKRIIQSPTSASRDPAIPWKKHMRVLYATSGLILLRNLVRTIEYFEGLDGWVISHEVMLYVFDAVPMLLVFVVLFVFHPCQLLTGEKSFVVRSQLSGDEMLGLEAQASETVEDTYRYTGK